MATEKKAFMYSICKIKHFPLGAILFGRLYIPGLLKAAQRGRFCRL